jgi:hypothetical protein
MHLSLEVWKPSPSPPGGNMGIRQNGWNIKENAPPYGGKYLGYSPTKGLAIKPADKELTVKPDVLLQAILSHNIAILTGRLLWAICKWWEQIASWNSQKICNVYMPKKVSNIQRIISNDILKIVSIVFSGGAFSPCPPPCCVQPYLRHKWFFKLHSSTPMPHVSLGSWGGGFPVTSALYILLNL